MIFDRHNHSMKLEHWLSKNDVQASDFAREVGISPSTVTRLINGERRPSGRMLQKIYLATKGKVAFADFFDTARSA